MTARATALLITPVRPDAYGTGSEKRAWSWAMELSRDHDLHTIVVSADEGILSCPVDVPGRCEFVRVEQRPSQLGLGNWILPASTMRQRFRALLPAIAPSRIVAFRFYLHSLVSLLPAEWRERTEIDCDDWESATYRSLALIEFKRGRYLRAKEALTKSFTYARLERRLLRKYPRVHFAAEEDASAFRAAVPGNKVATTPNRIAKICNEVHRHSGPLPRQLLFVGTMGWLPNEDAVLWFARKVARRLRRAVPGIRISVAGQGAPPSFSILPRHGVEYIGAPADISTCYREAGIALIVLRGGGGSKLKLLEAWMLRRPVVASSHAARGFGAQHGKHLLIADTPREIVAACQRLLSEPALADTLVREGYDLLEANYLLPEAPRQTSQAFN